jgi:hypothetical protein
MCVYALALDTRSNAADAAHTAPHAPEASSPNHRRLGGHRATLTSTHRESRAPPHPPPQHTPSRHPHESFAHRPRIRHTMLNGICAHTQPCAHTRINAGVNAHAGPHRQTQNTPPNPRTPRGCGRVCGSATCWWRGRLSIVEARWRGRGGACGIPACGLPGPFSVEPARNEQCRVIA